MLAGDERGVTTAVMAGGLHPPPSRLEMPQGGTLMDKDRIEGKKDQAKGFIKEKAGQIASDPDLEAEGKVDRAAGKIKEGVGKVKDKAREVIDDVTE